MTILLLATLVASVQWTAKWIGAYWGTATGWFCWTLARKDRALALRTFRDLATDYEKGGACECHYAAKAPCPWKDPRPCAGGYPANLGLPLAALRRFMFEGCYTVRRGADWIPVECSGIHKNM